MMFQAIFPSRHSSRPECQGMSFRCFKLRLAPLIAIERSLLLTRQVLLVMMKFSNSFMKVYSSSLIIEIYSWLFGLVQPTPICESCSSNLLFLHSMIEFIFTVVQAISDDHSFEAEFPPPTLKFLSCGNPSFFIFSSLTPQFICFY